MNEVSLVSMSLIMHSLRHKWYFMLDLIWLFDDYLRLIDTSCLYIISHGTLGQKSKNTQCNKLS